MPVDGGLAEPSPLCARGSSSRSTTTSNDPTRARRRQHPPQARRQPSSPPVRARAGSVSSHSSAVARRRSPATRRLFALTNEGPAEPSLRNSSWRSPVTAGRSTPWVAAPPRAHLLRPGGALPRWRRRLAGCMSGGVRFLQPPQAALSVVVF